MGASNSIIRATSNDLFLDDMSSCTNMMCDSMDSLAHEEFILTTVYPELKSYTCDDPSFQELLCLNVSNVDINNFPNMLEFDSVFFCAIRKYGKKCSFANKEYDFQKQFISELLSVIVYPGDSLDVLELRSKVFVKRFSFLGVPVTECTSTNAPLRRIIHVLVTFCLHFHFLRWSDWRGAGDGDAEPGGSERQQGLEQSVFTLYSRYTLNLRLNSI